MHWIGRTRVIGVTLGAVMAMFTQPTLAQTDLFGGQQCFTWSGDAGQAVVFRNKTGVKICDMWLTIGNDTVKNPPEIAIIEVDDSGAGVKNWDVDDNEDGDDNDANESDETDSTPQGNANGEHRTQAVTDTDGFNDNEVFTISLTAEGGASLKGKVICLWPTSKNSGHSGGDQGHKIAEPPAKVSMQTPSKDVSVDNAVVMFLGPPDFSIAVENVGNAPITSLSVATLHADVSVSLVESASGGTWNPGTGTFTFTVPIAPGTSRVIDYTLTGLTALGSQTVVRLSAAFAASAVPLLSEHVLLGLAVLLAVIGAGMLLRYRSV